MTLLVNIADSNSAQRVTTTGDTRFKTASFWGYKSFTSSTPNNNTNSVFIGLQSGQLPIEITSGSYFNWTLHPNQTEALNSFWIKGTAGDGVYIISY